MKRSTLTLILCSLIYISYSQVVVDDDGNVGIGNSSPASLLSVNTTGYSNYTASFQDNGYNRIGRFILDSPSYTGTSTNLSLYVSISNMSSGKNIAGKFNSWQSTGHSGRTFGIKAQAGMGAAGYNYGVFGTLIGTRDGAAIYGKVGDTEGFIYGKYAGFFEGNLAITEDLEVYDNAEIDGTLKVDGQYVTSDINLKTEVRDFNDDVFDKLKDLQILRYKLKPIESRNPNKDISTQNVRKIISAKSLKIYDR